MAQCQDLQVEYVSIDSIEPYNGNAKEHTEEQIEQIAESIKQFGFDDPIGIWENQIVEGHGRFLAAKKLKLKTVPVIRLDYLDDEGRRAYTLVHNKLTMDTGFNTDALDAELTSLTQAFDIAKYGFELSDTDGLDSGESTDNNITLLTVRMEPQQRDFVMDALKDVDISKTETYGNENSNGNALYEVIQEWQQLKMSS